MVKKAQKRYDTPEEGWEGERIENEKKFISDYGLKNKKEVWKSQSFIRNMRREARKLISSKDEKRKDNIIGKLSSLGLVDEDADLDDILVLDTKDVLNRRLQTLVYKKGFANTMKEARQIIAHGKVSIYDKKIDIPGYLVKKNEENDIKMEISRGEEDE